LSLMRLTVVNERSGGGVEGRDAILVGLGGLRFLIFVTVGKGDFAGGGIPQRIITGSLPWPASRMTGSGSWGRRPALAQDLCRRRD
jgi:hypothetical protein